MAQTLYLLDYFLDIEDRSFLDKDENGEDIVVYPRENKPTDNFSPFDSILFGDISMKEVLKIVANNLEQSATASEESNEVPFDQNTEEL